MKIFILRIKGDLITYLLFLSALFCSWVKPPSSSGWWPCGHMGILVTTLRLPAQGWTEHIYKINWSDCCWSVSKMLQDCKKCRTHIFLCILAPYIYIYQNTYICIPRLTRASPRWKHTRSNTQKRGAALHSSCFAHLQLKGEKRLNSEPVSGSAPPSLLYLHLVTRTSSHWGGASELLRNWSFQAVESLLKILAGKEPEMRKHIKAVKE